MSIPNKLRLTSLLSFYGSITLPGWYGLAFLCLSIVSAVLYCYAIDMFYDGPPRCHYCKSRGYTILTRPEKWQGGGRLLNVLINRYKCRCNTCGNIWSQRQ